VGVVEAINNTAELEFHFPIYEQHQEMPMGSATGVELGSSTWLV
jgi:hypothetical protein